jgi:hypothetical protein
MRFDVPGLDVQQISGGSGCYESRHLPGRLKVAPYEVRGKVAKNGHSPEGTADLALTLLWGKRFLVVTGDEPSVVPVGTEFLSDQPYPGLTSWATFRPSLRDYRRPTPTPTRKRPRDGEPGFPPQHAKDRVTGNPASEEWPRSVLFPHLHQ